MRIFYTTDHSFLSISIYAVAAPHRGVPGKVQEIPLPWLPRWQSTVVIMKFSNKIIWLPLLMRLMTCLCPAKSSGLAPPLYLRLNYGLKF